MLQLNDLSARIARHQVGLKAAVDRVISSGWLVMGPEVKRFEQAFAGYLGASHCLGVANGTEAIELALRAIGVKARDRVATVANAGAYTTTALLANGSVPLFIDVDLETQVATLDQVRRAMDQGVSAVVVTHLYGRAVPEIMEIARLCAERGVPLLEDCAQAHGARIAGRQVGTFGTVASFSFYPTKNLGALGDGGAVVTNDPVVAEKVAKLRQYGWSSKYCIDTAGGKNSRLDEMQAAILSEFLPALDETNGLRRSIAARYSKEINVDNLVVPPVGGAEYVAHLYVVRTPNRDSLREHLRQQGVASDIHYPIPDYRQPMFGQQFADLSLTSTDRLASEILTLPLYPEMSAESVDKVVSAVNGWAP
ncbi:erythromycin biosynthesis sensory transduction protein eryC1 [Burkholderia sp. Leaf177]|uniref:DegT/DnrJ/EryC1/StrS family aminotransferase n=1 Tax=Burkholderia sp. Leaf177 TaxID=1736287 RepID=UPI0006FC4815|nr:DegT/DnrJ/EryC1/StrS family aminotransferase [Burkholderia sp. Leaf177]KQR85476.1 erythromycin biosynthesis sensory transduction protein eryC1 [Burkholderia sp. Leaf177]